jgi:exopolysaccharide biosynthesis WecB/TagA/CpsF family protein
MQRAGRAELLGLAFDRETMASAVDRCLSWCAGPRAPHTVVTVNASHACMIHRDAELHDACRKGDLVIADGMSVLWALRLAGSPLPERVAGVDLMARLLEEGGRRSLSVFFLGARREVVTELARRSEAAHPGLRVVGVRDGYFSTAEHEDIVREIRAASPDLLFVGMPSPFKETWCERHRDRLGVPVIMGVGGSFDVLAGYVRRAPRFLQVAGMEWSWRLMMEPRKMWRRYLTTNSEFIWRAGREILARRWAGRPAVRQDGT